MKQIVLAGGLGKRTWDITKTPKQFFPLKNGISCFILTIQRALNILDPKDILIIINKKFISIALHQLNNFFPKNYVENFTIIIENQSKNTLSPVFYGLLHLKQNFSNIDQVIITPCDHIINNIESYSFDVANIIKQNNKINFLCVKPYEINDQYGHVIINKNSPSIKNFIEKPNTKTIQSLINSNELFFWNSGIYIANIDFLLNLLENFLSIDIKNNKNFKNTFFPIEKLFFLDRIIEDLMPIISIDLLFQNNVNNAFAHQINFDWLDIGCPKRLSTLMGL